LTGFVPKLLLSAVELDTLSLTPGQTIVGAGTTV